MGRLRLKLDEAKDAEKAKAKPPRFAPAGQSTQMIVGATAATDADILGTSNKLYRSYGLRRVYYSAFSPIAHADPRLPPAAPPLVREHRKAQLRTRMVAGEACQENDLIFCQDDGTPWKPDYVSRRFKALAAAPGLSPIKLHEGRHSAASLARDAEVDPEIRRRTLGHADAAMTSHYTHIDAQALRGAAEAVAALVQGAES